jgi:hypothetical protein
MKIQHSVLLNTIQTAQNMICECNINTVCVKHHLQQYFSYIVTVRYINLRYHSIWGETKDLTQFVDKFDPVLIHGLSPGV